MVTTISQWMSGLGRENTLLALLLGISAIQALLLVFLWLRLTGISRKYSAFMAGTEAASLEDKILELIGQAGEQQEKMKELHWALRQVEQTQKDSVQHVGVVRFNAFEDTGSDLSFAVAVLDGHHNGVVLSSLYGREESRVYAKPISAGKSNHLLTDEELAAMIPPQKKDLRRQDFSRE